jgi:hypothetical protein
MAAALAGAAAWAAEGGGPPVEAVDTPFDAGNSVTVRWEKPPYDKPANKAFGGYQILRRGPGATAFTPVGVADRGDTSFKDTGLQDVDPGTGVAYRYAVYALPAAGPPVKVGDAEVLATGPKVDVKWPASPLAATPGFRGYEVRRAVNAYYLRTFDTVGEVAPGVTTYEDKPEPDKVGTYAYYIFARVGRKKFEPLGPAQARVEGGTVVVSWTAPATPPKGCRGYEVRRALAADVAKVYEVLGQVGPGVLSFRDAAPPEVGLRNGAPYEYRVFALPVKGAPPVKLGDAGARAGVQWYNVPLTNILIGVVVVTGIIAFFIYHAKGGAELFVRKIAGLDAVDEAIGRATEMGKPILFVSGLSTADDISTVAAMTVLAKVARKTAEYETPLLVPCYDPIVMLVEKEMVREAYMEAGKPDAFDEDSVFFVTQSQFGYVAAVDGLMVREKPATNIYMGAFFAESLLLAETGAATGAIQIAGTDRVTQLPFFITACDYTLMGEELYAATAYLSRNPLFLGSLKGQDWSKALLIAAMIIGTTLFIVSTDAGVFFANLFKTAAEAGG